MTITLSTCFYIIKSKFNPSTYIQWMNNLISIVSHFNLVIYTDESSSIHINTNDNPRIRIVIKPISQFHNYQYKDEWIANHHKNSLLNHSTCWELNMLWSEKIWFVKETIDNLYFNTTTYGWCDVGYFRNRPNDIQTNKLTNFGKTWIETDKICYACVCNDNSYINMLGNIIVNRNQYGLPTQEIPSNQISVAGGFFMLRKDLIDWWATTYDTTLQLYFKHGYLVKDDQIIIVDCLFSNMEKFTVFQENRPEYDNWFMFQRILNTF